MKRPIWATATALCFSLVTSHNALLAASVRTIPVGEARGELPSFPTLTIWEETGLNINFIPTGEVVKKVWLDDPSRLGVDFDGILCVAESGNCSDTGATVIHLRRINPIKFPQLPKTQATLLSVVTQGKDGAKNLYQFHVAYGRGQPQYVAVNITPAINSSLSQQPQKLSTTQGSLIETQPQLQGEPVISPATIPVNPARTANKPVVTLLNRQPATTISVEEQIRLIEAGMANAKKKNLIGKQRKNLYLAQRVEQLIGFLRQGNSVEDSARRARIPIHFINTLKQLGSTSVN